MSIDHSVIGILCNVDQNVLSCNKGRFRVTAWPYPKLLRLVARLKGVDEWVADSSLFLDSGVVHGEFKKSEIAYVLEGNASIPVLPAKATHEEHEAQWKVERQLFKEVEDYGRLLRLSAEGHPAVRAAYIYRMLGRRAVLTTSTEYEAVDPEPFVVSAGGDGSLRAMINSQELLFSQDYLHLAYEHFEESYSSRNPNLKFLSLMIALEVLFNDGPQELRYRVSRAVALVLGTDRHQARGLFKEAQSLYDKRSKLVHTGKSGVVRAEDVVRLRCLVRQSILAINRWGCTKESLSKSLTESGFGAFEPSTA